MKNFVHGKEVIDVNTGWILFERFHKSWVNEDFVSLSTFFHTRQNGVIKTDHTGTPTIVGRARASTYLNPRGV
jgi:hypothetical protein